MFSQHLANSPLLSDAIWLHRIPCSIICFGEVDFGERRSRQRSDWYRVEQLCGCNASNILQSEQTGEGEILRTPAFSGVPLMLDVNVPGASQRSGRAVAFKGLPVAGCTVMLGFTGLHAPLPSRKAELRAHLAPAMKADIVVGPALTRRAVLSTFALAAVGAIIAPAPESVTASEVAGSALNIKVVTKGVGAKVVFGDLVAIRFKGSYNDIAFDNTFETPEPYFYRAGSGLILKVGYSRFRYSFAHALARSKKTSR
jgi:hypothetical protein